ncbi:MAG: NHL repeat-containing protein [Candidatus Latescibacterota bacterium]
MQKTIRCLPWLGLMLAAFLALPDASGAAGRLAFQDEFGGKGSGAGQFGREIYLTFDREGACYVSDSDNRRILRVAEPTREIKSERFRHPKDLAIDDAGRIYVVDWQSTYMEDTKNPKLYAFEPCIHVLGADGTLLRTISVSPDERRPKGLAEAVVIVDEEGAYSLGIKSTGYDRDFRIAANRHGTIYLLDVSRNEITKFSPGGERLATFASYGAGEGQLDRAQDLIVTQYGSLYVADSRNHRIVVFDSDGDFRFSFGRKGLRSGELVRPFALATDSGGRISVADEGAFERRFEDHPFGRPDGAVRSDWLTEALLSEDRSDHLYELRRRLDELEYSMSESGETRELADLKKRVAELEDTNREEDEEEEETPERYLKVLRRIQVFDSEGTFVGKALFTVDKNDPELHDLSLQAMDSMGTVYLRDESGNTLRRYRMLSPGLPRWQDMERAYGVRATKEDELYREDFGDLDTLIDEKSQRDRWTLQQAFSLNYDLSEHLNLSIKDRYHYTRRLDAEQDLDKPQNDSDIDEDGYDNALGANLRYVLDPNRYTYREMNIFAKRLDGYTTYLRTSPDVSSDEQTRRTGDAGAWLLGSDYDLTRDVNLSLGYSRFQPDQSRRNYRTYLFDDQGRLYRVDEHFNRRSVLVGELKVKF